MSNQSMSPNDLEDQAGPMNPFQKGEWGSL